MRDRNDPLRWAYAAGIIDGEGCISIHRVASAPKRRPGVYRYTVTISLAMNDPESVLEVADLFDRPVCRGKACCKAGSGVRYIVNPYRVVVSSVQEVQDTLQRLMPYLRAKREQADAVLAICGSLQEWRSKQTVPQEVRDQWAGLYEVCRAHKVRNASEVVPAEAA